ncbi:MAG: hypothetical protein WKF55_09115 [Gemmatimonadaceae bacterium]
MIKEFEFVDAGRTFFCSVETPRHAGAPPWWWFRVNDEGSTRYAPFEAQPSDTRKSVQERVVAYYAEVLAIKARPVHQRPVWHKPARPIPSEEPSPALSTPVTGA